jgi:hypothetical protein
MRKIGRSKVEEQTRRRQQYLPHLPLREFAREALWDTVVLSGLAFVEEELEAERTALCGPRYAHVAGRRSVRAMWRVLSPWVAGGPRLNVRGFTAPTASSCRYRAGRRGVRATIVMSIQSQ